MEQQVTPAIYTGWIIVESISDPEILESMHDWLVWERITNLPTDEEPIWHIREYHVPANHLPATMHVLEGAIKPGWYLHFVNIPEEILYVILSGKTFKLPLQRNECWEPMIVYGISVGVEREWTENIPVR